MFSEFLNILAPNDKIKFANFSEKTEKLHEIHKERFKGLMSESNLAANNMISDAILFPTTELYKIASLTGKGDLDRQIHYCHELFVNSIRHKEDTKLFLDYYAKCKCEMGRIWSKILMITYFDPFCLENKNIFYDFIISVFNCIVLSFIYQISCEKKIKSLYLPYDVIFNALYKVCMISASPIVTLLYENIFFHYLTQDLIKFYESDKWERFIRDRSKGMEEIPVHIQLSGCYDSVSCPELLFAYDKINDFYLYGSGHQNHGFPNNISINENYSLFFLTNVSRLNYYKFTKFECLQKRFKGFIYLSNNKSGLSTKKIKDLFFSSMDNLINISTSIQYSWNYFLKKDRGRMVEANFEGFDKWIREILDYNSSCNVFYNFMDLLMFAGSVDIMLKTDDSIKEAKKLRDYIKRTKTRYIPYDLIDNFIKGMDEFDKYWKEITEIRSEYKKNGLFIPSMQNKKSSQLLLPEAIKRIGEPQFVNKKDLKDSFKFEKKYIPTEGKKSICESIAKPYSLTTPKSYYLKFFPKKFGSNKFGKKVKSDESVKSQKGR